MRLSLLLTLLLIRLSAGDPNLEDEAMDSCDDEPVEKRIKTVCYFATSRKSGSETVERKKAFQVSDSCEGNLLSQPWRIHLLARPTSSLAIRTPHSSTRLNNLVSTGRECASRLE
ncbi:hypothetical protein PFISCL1PPCAC_3045, partial [Pristionchus fissidentatus]